MAIDHLGIFTPADKHAETLAFYLAALGPLGYKKMIEIYDGKVVGIGATSPDFWVNTCPDGDDSVTGRPNHFAFSAHTRALVDECYKKGLEAGGKDNGGPGPRPQYHGTYYGAFIKDPVGNNMEIVNHREGHSTPA